MSIDDLLAAPLPARPRLGGPGPFVINLSASTAPISQPLRGMADFPGTYVYQIQRIEDHRPRFRLRLGPFAREDDADAALDKVRDLYPSALTATAEADDLRAISGLQTKQDAPQQRPPHAPAPPAEPEAALRATPPPMPAEAPVLSDRVEPARAPTSRPASGAAAPSAYAPAVPTFTASVPRAAAAAPAAPARSGEPTARSAPPPAAGLRAAGLGVAPAPPLAAPRVPEPAARIAPAGAAPAASPTVPARRVEQLSTRLSSLDSTQTLRVLTTVEAEDEESRWYVIQLSLAEDSFDPDTLPNLDIFSEYRLYSVAGFDQGRVMHALRLGFFKDAVAAGAVAGYLDGFYENPVVKPVSAAERERFGDQRVEARKDVGATGRHAVIEITSERVVRENRGAAAAAASATAPPSRVTPLRKR